MKLSVSAYRAHASAHKKILSNSYHSQQHNYGSTASASTSTPTGYFMMDQTNPTNPLQIDNSNPISPDEAISAQGSQQITPTTPGLGSEEVNKESVHKAKSRQKNEDDELSSNPPSSGSKSPSQRKNRIVDANADSDSDWNKSNQRWMKLRTTVQISSAIQKKPPLKREDSFLKRFSTRQIPDAQETVEDTGSESASGDTDKTKTSKRRRRFLRKRKSVVNPDENFYFYWLMVLCTCVLYNLWTLIVRQSFPELQEAVPRFWFACDILTDIVFVLDIAVQLRTGYLEQGLMVYDDKKLAFHYMRSRAFFLDIAALLPLDLLQLRLGSQPLLRFPRFLKVYRSVRFYYIVESRTVWPNLWRVVNLIHILLILAHWFGCFYYLLSEAEGFQGDWVYPYRPGDYATLTRKYLGSLYWSTLTLTTIGDLPTPETNAEYVFTIVSYLIGVFIFATIVGQVGNVITNRNANRLEFERLLDGAKTYMRHHKVPGGMKRRVLRWYDYSWSRGRIQGGGDINTALGLLPDKLKTELALHVNLSVLKKVTIFQECQPEFLHDLVLKMKAYIFTPGDSICRKGEVAREMFIIADGILEVLSETGKVLTTMKAGDFFGEIGILNLDGLNKRTADVRSVGYSELFSLSREDVLAAMKDYPDAQEILQTLGRKRLMEVRCVNKKHLKAQSDKEFAMNQHNNQHHHNHQQHQHVSDNSSENSASKKIVDKIKSDVMGIKSVLKKSRTSRRSNESLEMQPLHTNTSPKILPKGMLKRMSRVKSDDDKRPTFDSGEIDGSHHLHSSSAGAIAHSEAKDKTPSPIGAGLPLLQRLRLLKEKQDREERAVKSTQPPLPPQPPQKSPPHSIVTSTLSPQESIQEEPEIENEQPAEALPLIQRLQFTNIQNAQSQEKNPFKQAAQGVSMISTTTTSDQGKLKSPSSLIPTTSEYHIEGTSSTIPSVSSGIKVSFRDRIKNLQAQTAPLPDDDDSPLSSASVSAPTSAATISPSPMGKAIPTIETPTATATLTMCTSNSNTMVNKIIISKPSINSKSTTSCSNFFSSNNKNLDSSDSSCPHHHHHAKISKPILKTSLSIDATESEQIMRPWSKLKVATLATSNSFNNLTNLQYQQQQPTTGSLKPLDIGPGTDSNQKFYESVFDLSPEYNGLPFVKRLKILNERQKLAELESALQQRSFSLDYQSPRLGVDLYRCHSEAAGVFNTANLSSFALSPESNETQERKRLKSILKNLQGSGSSGSAGESKGLSKAPTLEGPPRSANAIETEPQISSTEPQISHSQSKPKHFLFLPSEVNTYNAQLLGHKSSSAPAVTSEVPTKLDFKGTHDPEEYFNQILLGINNIITTHMHALHVKFENQFSIMESEVRKRDDLINDLQMRMNLGDASAAPITTTMSTKTVESAVGVGQDRKTGDCDSPPDKSSSGSSGELLFMRGDSLDTIFTSSPPTNRQLQSQSTIRRLSADQNTSAYQGNGRRYPCNRSWSEYHDMMVTNYAGNMPRYNADSVILDIGESSDSETSDSSSQGNDNIIVEEEPVGHNDWEVRMLAEEMEKQEQASARKRGQSLDQSTELKRPGGILRRRRKLSDTETSHSETDPEATAPATSRPRAGSLDQFNLRYSQTTSSSLGGGNGSRGVSSSSSSGSVHTPTTGRLFKALNIDRNKDKL